MRLPIDTSYRVGAIGATRVGKTTVMESLLGQLPRCMIIDTKDEFARKPKGKQHRIPWDDEVIITSNPRMAIAADRSVYKPKDLVPDEDFWMEVWKAYGNDRSPAMVIYVDEILDIAPSQRAPRGLLMIAQKGGSKRLSLWYSAQTPNIHNSILANTDVLLLFRNAIGSHREKLRDIVGEYAEATKVIPKYHFIMFDRNDPEKPIKGPYLLDRKGLRKE